MGIQDIPQVEEIIYKPVDTLQQVVDAVNERHSVNFTTGDILVDGKEITNALKAAPDWNPDIGVVACLIASDFGVMDVSRTLFNPRIIGNAVVFEGKVEYGNRPGLRTYSNIPDRIAIANAKYYPN